MKIVFGTVTILDSSANGLAVSGFRRSGDSSAQEVQLFRAAAAKFIDRGNRKTEMSWEAVRSHASQQAAEEFALTHDAALLGNQDAVITEADASTIRYLRNAVCKAQTSFLGAFTTRTNYTLRGGLLAAPDGTMPAATA